MKTTPQNLKFHWALIVQNGYVTTLQPFWVHIIWIQLYKEQLQYGMHSITLAKGKSKTQKCTPQKDMYNLD